MNPSVIVPPINYSSPLFMQIFLLKKSSCIFKYKSIVSNVHKIESLIMDWNNENVVCDFLSVTKQTLYIQLCYYSRKYETVQRYNVAMKSTIFNNILQSFFISIGSLPSSTETNFSQKR